MMIKVLSLIFSLNLFAIIPGVYSPGSVDTVLKLQFKRFGLSKGGICTGTAISKTKILTAGHCVKNYLKSIPSFLKLSVNSKNYLILDIEVPSGFEELQNDYDHAIESHRPFANELKILSKIDIAIITIGKKLNSNIKIVKLPLAKKNEGLASLCGYGYSFYGDNLYSGNKSNQLLCGTNTFIADKNYLYIKGNILNTSVSSSMTAPGDSGSPLLNTNGEQLGVLSGIIKDESGEAASFYANLFNLKDFIQSHL